MNNQNLKFMKNREINPYEFYFLDEENFQTLVNNLDKTQFKKASLLGNIEYENNMWYLTFGNCKIQINITRINDLAPNVKKENFPPFYILYGEIKVENGTPVFVVQFHRNLGTKVDLGTLKTITIRKREIVTEAKNQDDNLF